jgi:ubiquitin C-terminal hydrolase
MDSDITTDQTQYELIGLTVHLGSINNGHYVAYCQRNSNWYEFDDEVCRKVKESEVLNQEAYLLFYKKCTA